MWQCAWRARLSAPVGLWSSVRASKFLGAQDQDFFTQLNSATSLYYKNRELKSGEPSRALTMTEHNIFKMSKLLVRRSAEESMYEVRNLLSRFGMSGANVARRSSTFGLPEHDISVVSESLPSEFVAFQ